MRKSLLTSGLAVLGLFTGVARAAILTTPEYTTAANSDPGGMAFNFVDISGTGTMIFSGDDEAPAEFAMGASFTFYGHSYPNIRMNSNGYLIFSDPPGLTATDPNDFANQAFPNSVFSFASMTAYWDDLVTTGYYQHFAGGAGGFAGPTSVFMWDGTTLAGGNPVRFEVLLDHLTGRFLYQYDTVFDGGSTATIAIANTVLPAPQEFLQYSHNSSSIPNDSTILFTPVPEPGSVGLLAFALGGLILQRYRRR